MSGHDHTPAVHDHADSWHHHEPAEGRPQAEHAGVANPALIARWFAMILVAVIGLVIILSVYFVKYATVLRNERVETFTYISRQANEARRDADALLGMNGATANYEWADPTTGAVQLPIDRAMKIVVERYSGK